MAIYLRSPNYISFIRSVVLLFSFKNISLSILDVLFNYSFYFNAVLSYVIVIIFTVTYSFLRLIDTVLDVGNYSSISFSFNIEPVDVESPCSLLFTAVSIFVPWSVYLRSLVRFKSRQEYNVLELAQVFTNFLFCHLYFLLYFYLAPFRVISFYY